MNRLEARWDARQSGLEPLTVTVSTPIRASAHSVWKFLEQPASAGLIDPDVVKTFHVPGTPEQAVGEQGCVIIQSNGRLSAHIHETVAIDPNARIVHRWLTFATETVTSWTLEAHDDDATTLTYQIGTRVGAGQRRKLEPQARDRAVDTLRRIRAAIEAGVSFASN